MEGFELRRQALTGDRTLCACKMGWFPRFRSQTASNVYLLNLGFERGVAMLHGGSTSFPSLPSKPVSSGFL